MEPRVGSGHKMVTFYQLHGTRGDRTKEVGYTVKSIIMIFSMPLKHFCEDFTQCANLPVIRELDSDVCCKPFYLPWCNNMHAKLNKQRLHLIHPVCQYVVIIMHIIHLTALELY